MCICSKPIVCMDGVPHSFATSKINTFELMCCHVTTSMELIHWLQIADNERSEKTEEKKKAMQPTNHQVCVP